MQFFSIFTSFHFVFSYIMTGFSFMNEVSFIFLSFYFLLFLQNFYFSLISAEAVAKLGLIRVLGFAEITVKLLYQSIENLAKLSVVFSYNLANFLRAFLSEIFGEQLEFDDLQLSISSHFSRVCFSH